MVNNSNFWEQYSKLFNCSIEELQKFTIDFFSAENIIKAEEVIDKFVDSHPLKDNDKITNLLSYLARCNHE